MSHLESNSSNNRPDVPRRTILQGLAAAPIAVATASGSAHVARQNDERFAAVDKLIAEIDAAESLWRATDERSQQELWQQRNDAYHASCQALNDFEEELAKRLVSSDLDVALFAKIASFWWSTDDLDCDLERYPSFRRVIEGCLTQARVTPYRPKELPTADNETDGALSPRANPWGANAGSLIQHIQSHGNAYHAAMSREGAIPDDTPLSKKAMATTDRRYAELKALRDVLLGNAYHLNQVEQFTVWFTLIETLRPDFVTDLAHGDVGPILQRMSKAAALWRQSYLEQAERRDAQEAGGITC